MQEILSRSGNICRDRKYLTIQFNRILAELGKLKQVKIVLLCREGQIEQKRRYVMGKNHDKLKCKSGDGAGWKNEIKADK